MSKLTKISVFLSLFGLFLSNPSLAQNPIQQIAQLNATGQAQAAYELSTQLLSEYEGEPAFDLHYGVAAVDYGRVSEGVFALERVLMNQPNNDYARLELGRAYFALEEDDRAEEEFNKVLAANPPEEVQENVQHYLRAINSRKYKREAVWGVNLLVRSGYDSNVNAASDEANFGGTELLNTDESSAFIQYKADATYSKPIVYGTAGFISAYVTKNDNLNPNIVDGNNEPIDLDVFGYGVKAGLSKEQNEHNFRFTLQADSLELDGDAFRDSYGASASWTYALNPQLAMTTFGLISKNSFTPDRSFRDSTLAIFGASFTQAFTSRYNPRVNIGFHTGRDNAEEDGAGALANTQSDVFGVNALMSLSLSENLLFDTSVSMRRGEYQGPQLVAPGDSVETAVREDIRYALNLGLSWFARENLQFKLDASLSESSSTIQIWEHDRHQVAASAQYSFR